MRIALVEPAGRGGLIHYAYQLGRALAAAGAEVTLVTDRCYELDHLPQPFDLHKVLRLWDPKPAGSRSGSSPAVWRKLRRAGRAVAYYREWGRLVRHLRRLHPDVVQLGDVRFAADVLPVSLLARSGFSLADVCHNLRPLALGGRSAGLFSSGGVSRRLFRQIYRRFTVVFAHGEDTRRRLIAMHGLDPRRVVAIPHGNELLFAELADPTRTSPSLREELGLGVEEPVVLLFGTLARYKGVDLALEAHARLLRRCPDARLVVVGFPLAGFDVEEHRRLAQRLGVGDATRLVPRYVPSEEVAAWMELAAVALFPYRDVSQSGALQVALSFGVPTVATAVGGLSEAVRQGVTGLLVPPADPEALAAALEALLTDRELASRLGSRAAAESRSRYGWDRVAARVLDAYDGLLAPPAAEDAS
ncbi:MAG TPA: glycosyltransferase family 4 protein [Thermoanaerobaculia bacterium]|nr:glycosyltransferase family 4 protein [Thermoanaerobaculia bacterium]